MKALRSKLKELRIAPNKVTLSLRKRDAARFARRELWVLLSFGSLAGWGYVNH